MQQRHQLSESQLQAFERAREKLNPERLKELLVKLTNIHSPTGNTRQISEFMQQHLANIGMKAQYKPISQNSGNFIGEYRGTGGGASVMLYAHLDTHLDDLDAEKLLIGTTDGIDLQPEALVHGDWVYGLGSSNPKAMLATLTEVATALLEADVALTGDLIIAGADGGMPVDIAAHNYTGMSSGILHLLSRGLAPDFAIVMKPWNWVYHEEPGIAWFKIYVHGTMGYAGVSRNIPGATNSILPATQVIQELEQWIIEYSKRNTSGVVKPYGRITGVSFGDAERSAYTAAITEIRCDVRINPRTTPAQVKAQFAEFIKNFQAQYPDITLEWNMFGSIPGGTTNPENWIVSSCLNAWEFIEQRPHGQPDLLGGQTDGAALRRWGIPTVRVGWPWPATGSPLPITEGLGGMGATYIPDLMPCAEKILYTLIDTLTRPRTELGV